MRTPPHPETCAPAARLLRLVFACPRLSLGLSKVTPYPGDLRGILRLTPSEATERHPERRRREEPALSVAKGSAFPVYWAPFRSSGKANLWCRSEEHTSELQSQSNLVCRLL